MIRIAALNDETVDAPAGDASNEVSTKEAQEEAAFSLYNKALQLQNDGNFDEALTIFKELLSMRVLRGVRRSNDDDDDNSGRLPQAATSQSLLLKYSAYKNMAHIANTKGEYEVAMECYLEATYLDDSDVTIWYRTGLTALKLHNYPLAKLAFLEGLRCNPNHWPCLDHIITVLYALNNYSYCLYYISQALKRDSLYGKGLAFRDQIYREHPGLRKDCSEFFADCDEQIYSGNYDEEEEKKFVEEALKMRRIKHELSQPKKPPILNFTKPLASKTFKNIGECLVDLYDVVHNAERPISFSCSVNVEKYIENKDSEKEASGNCSFTSSSSGSNSVSDEQATPTNVPVVIVTSPCHVSDGGGVEQSVMTQAQISQANTAFPEASGNLDVDEGQSLSQGEVVMLPESISANSRRGRKRKSFFFDCLDAASKRRSARVRNTVIKNQPENVNYSKLLETFLPSSLLSNDDDNKPADLENGKNDPSTSNEGHCDGAGDVESRVSAARLESCEAAEVKTFLVSVRNNIGVLNIMYKYLIALAKKHAFVWPDGLSNVYLDVYVRLRSHITQPSLFSTDVDEDDFRDGGFMTLVYCEFKVESWLVANSHIQGNASRSPSLPFRIPSPAPLSADFSAMHFVEDVDFLTQLMINSSMFGDNRLEFSTRVLLLKARSSMLQNQMDVAVGCLEMIVELFSEEEASHRPCIRLVNCKVDNVVTLENVRKQLESLQQCQSLEELHRLHEAGEYQQVVALLMPTMAKPHTARKLGNGNNIPERHAQLWLLQDSLWNLGDQKQCLFWGEASIHEALMQYKSTSSREPSHRDWANTLTQLLSKLERCVRTDVTILRTLAPTVLRRLIKSLIEVIVIQMDCSESVTDGSLKTVVPWILLFRAIRQEEEKIRSLLAKSVKAEKCKGTDEPSKGDDGDMSAAFGGAEFGPAMPSSLMLLFNAHEHLGRRGWCCHSDGALLLLYVDVLTDELLKASARSTPHPFKEDFEASIEQCFYCLYGHPNRKAKARHLQEHSAPQISLSWERARPLFEYFRPKQLPEFDSYKASTVSIEVEHLLRRILTLVPHDHDPAPRVDHMCAYVEGSVQELPKFDCDLSTQSIVSELYYLLADYYFKNNEQGKAIKFYLHDVCVTPDRFNSWAGMALARSSQLEQKLNSCDLRFDGPVYRRAAAALRCFARALELEPAVASLWVENGSLAYMVHSYVCRQLKQRVQFELSVELVQLLKNKRSSMLKTAQSCFKSANQCEEGAEEEWLHHYMLGKITEKMNKPPQEYLAHYKMAALHLHLEGAAYPNRIQYHQPPHLAMEALEVYYRTHASILKFLMRQEGQPLDRETAGHIEEFLDDAAEEPFAKFQEKRHAPLDLSDVEGGELLLAEQRKKLRKVSPLANDHDYFRRKRKSTSNEDLTAEPRTDSSSESQDSVAVKDLLNSLVSVISERQNSSAGEGTATIVVGDAKIYRPPSQAEGEIVTGAESPGAEDEIKVVRVVAAVRDERALEDDDGKSCRSIKSEEDTRRSSDIGGVSPDKRRTIGDGGVSMANDHRTLVGKCEIALRQCLQRFPQHYKSIYRVAHYYAKSKCHKNLQWSLDYLVGPKTSWQQCAHMVTPALFAERKNSNFFNGNWRIPIDEIDRPGSFATHMFRSVLLTITVLEQSGEHNLLVQITAQLHRNPDTGKKYLRDVDRLYLATLSYERSVRAILRKMKLVCRDSDSPRRVPRAVRHMLDTYRAWQTLQKVVSNPEIVNTLLEKCYDIFQRGKLDEPLPCLDQAIRYCQHQLMMEKLPLDDVSLMPLKPMLETKSSGPMGESAASSKAKSVARITGGASGSNIESRSHHMQNVPCHKMAPAQATSNFATAAAASHALSSPSILTADVQSKIKSLDPIEPYRMLTSKQMSGFQMEFLRQITANAWPPPPPPPLPPATPKHDPKGVANVLQRKPVASCNLANKVKHAEDITKLATSTNVPISNSPMVSTQQRSTVKACFVQLDNVKTPECKEGQKTPVEQEVKQLSNKVD